MHYFKPEDVTLGDAEKVLDYLNTVESAEAIAARIEFEDELDIGIKVGARLLAAREANGGLFPSLQSVADVAYVGPERFTEIVCGIANLPLPWLVAREKDPIYDELHRLRTIVDGFSKASAVQANIEIYQDIGSPLLGQPLNIIVKAFDANGLPLVNRPLTLETNQGILTTQYGLDARKGEVVQSVTGVDGSARIKLSYQTYERLSEEQRTALETELNFINNEAGSPAELDEGFSRFSTRYEQENNLHLRAAMDVYFNDSQRQLKDTINNANHMIDWTYKTALVRVYLHPPVEEGMVKSDSVVTMATHLVRWKNWVLPWYQSYLQFIQERENLSLRLLNTKTKLASSSGLGQNLLNETHHFMANQHGRVGSAIGEEIAGRSMMKFLSKDIEDLAPEQQASLFPTLSLAASSIKASGQGTLALVNKTRTDLESQVVNAQIDTSMINSVNSKIDTFNQDYEQFQADKSQFDSNYATFEINYNVFDANYQTFDTEYAAFTVDYANFNLDKTRIDTNLASLESDLSVVTTDVSGIKAGTLTPK